jgi:hypothetical protein
MLFFSSLWQQKKFCAPKCHIILFDFFLRWDEIDEKNTYTESRKKKKVIIFINIKINFPLFFSVPQQHFVVAVLFFPLYFTIMSFFFFGNGAFCL